MHAPDARRALAAGALATILVAPLSGCESGDDDASPSPPASPSASASPSEPAPTSSPSDTASPTSTPTSTETGGAGETDAPIPTDAVDYADALIIAWGAGEQERMAELATPEAIETLTTYGEGGGPNWDRVGQDAGAGSSFVRYENTQDGSTLEVRVENEAASQGQEQAVAEVKFG